MSRPRSIAIVLAALLAGFQISTLTVATQTKLAITDVRLKPTLLLPAVCDGKRMKSGFTDNGIARISVSANTDLPLNVSYTVTAGRVAAQGLTATWDLNGNAPGNYSITVQVDDGVGHRSTAVTKTVLLAEPDIECPCECPSIEIWSHKPDVRRGNLAAFSVRLRGGKVDRPTYNWTVTNGVIKSGQGTTSIEVTSTGSEDSEIVATVEIGGPGLECGCSVKRSESVRIEGQTTGQDFPARVNWVDLDRTSVVLDACPKGANFRAAILKSYTPTVTVTTGAWGNRVGDRLTYSYSVTGGRIVGTGPKVVWDLTDLTPGTYEVSVDVDDGRGVSAPKTATLTIAEKACPDLFDCPSISLAEPHRIESSDDYIVRSTVPEWALEGARYIWTASGGTIVAGQGSPSVRVRARWNATDPTPSVELRLAMKPPVPPDYCGAATVLLSKSKPRPEL